MSNLIPFIKKIDKGIMNEKDKDKEKYIYSLKMC